MTLIVARRTHAEVVIASDIRVTDPDQIRRGYPYAVLKAVTITPHLCVAFANDVERGLGGVRAVADLDSSDFQKVLDRLAEHSLPTHGKAADFLAVSSRPARIARISGGAIDDNQLQGWIGDHDAFAAFQQAFHSSLEASEGQPAVSIQALTSRVSAAFQALVHGPVASVGEAPIIITTREDGVLRYQSYAIAHIVPQTLSGGGGTLHFGSAAEGGHGFTILTPRDAGPGAIGLYFAHGRLGLFYHPLKSREAYAYVDVTQKDFERRVDADHDYVIKGLLTLI